MSLDRHSEAIANRVYGNRKQGFVLSITTIISIVATLIPLLVQCFQKKSSEVKPYVESKWDPAKGYDETLIRRTMVQAKRAAKEHGSEKVSKEELREIAIQTLDEARLNDNQTVGATLDTVPDILAD